MEISRLEAVIASMVFRQYPTIEATIRELKQKGASKLLVRSRIDELTEGSDLLHNALAIAIDVVWAEESNDKEKS